MKTPAANNILITGAPGVGKTTLIKHLSQIVSSRRQAGFFTEEIREDGVRKGFMLVSLDGKRRTLAHTEINNRYRVGKYGVDIEGFERFLENIDLINPTAELLIIDEIGKMECMSGRFKYLLQAALDSPIPLVATIALKGGGIFEQIKERSDSVLLEITRTNRESLISKIIPILDLREQ